MLEKALQYQKAGKPIFPVGKDKRPIVEWKQFQTRIPTAEEVKTWWTIHPEANIGMATGKLSGISVVDIDPKNGGTVPAGMPTMTTVIATGGGGWHYYFKHIEGVTNQDSGFLGVDIRGEGGYVVVPPSVHQSGIAYEVIVSEPLVSFPVEFFKFEKKKFDAALVVNGVKSGDRNMTATRLVGSLIAKYHRREEWESIVFPLLRAWDKNNSPPLGEQQLRVVFESIAKKHASTHTEELPETPQEYSFLNFTQVLLQASDELDNLDPKSVISFGYDWLDDRLTGLFPGQMAVFGGESGSGKTTFATNIIYKASKNRKCVMFALEDRLLDYGLTAIYFEIGRIRRRKNKFNHPWNIYRRNEIQTEEYFSEKQEAIEVLSNGNIEFLVAEKMVTVETIEEIIRKKTEEGTNLFLLDHLHYVDLSRGKASKADYIEQVVTRLKSVLNSTGASLLMIVHYKKLEGKKPTLDSFKDSISIVQNANYVISLWRDRNSNDEKERYKTTFFIPKARNPNGECQIEVDFDKNTNDYKPISQWQTGTRTYETESDPNKFNI